jgi:hypothetical protein
MLGAVEVSGLVAGGHIASVEIVGDLLAPFETLDALSVACEGLPAASAAIGRAVTSVLSSPGRFVLGIRDLGELIGRLS